jgi:peptide/nickel transport system permease protein
MIRKLTKYLLLAVAVLIFNFILPRLLPGSPIAGLAGEETASLTQAEKQRILETYDLDQPVLEQFFRYVQAIYTGDLGVSFSKKLPVRRILAAAIPWTLLLSGSSIGVSFLAGSVLGACSAVLRRKKTDMPLLLGITLFSSFPVFWISIVLIAVFGMHLHWLPLYGAYSMWRTYTGFQRYVDILSHLILPMIALSFGSMPLFFTTFRTSFLQILDEDYIKMARARGLSKARIYFFYCWRNAMIPGFTVLMLDLGQILGGSIVVEAVFSYPGLGRVLYDAVLSRDYPLMQYSFLLIAVMTLAACFITDMVYPLLDPRVKL